jgi:hypothetical protein
MKIKKNIITITIVSAIFLVIVSGCTTKVNEINPAQSDELDNYKEFLDSNVPITIKIDFGTNFKDEIIKLIEISKKNRKEDSENYDNHFVNRISDINEFYSPTVEINGFIRHSVMTDGYALDYCYTPIETQKSEEDNDFNYYTGITIIITRKGWIRDESVNQFEHTVKQGVEQGWGSLTEENLLYNKTSRQITAPIGDNSCLIICVPEKLNNCESLRDLAFEVIETAELVVVEDYLQ